MENPDLDDPEYEIIERYRDPEYEELWWVAIYRYVLQPLNIIDLVAVVPFYIEIALSSGSSLSIIRILRLARVIRLAKSGKGRFTKGLKILSNTLITSAPMNAFLLAVALIIFVVCGAIAFLIEGGEFRVSAEYPDGAYMRTDLLGEHLEPTPFLSVLHGMYWSVVTSTTVGYGDLYATTAGGRVFACACTFLGIVVIAMPVTVLGTHFSKEYEREYMPSADKPTGNAMQQSQSFTSDISGVDGFRTQSGVLNQSRSFDDFSKIAPIRDISSVVLQSEIAVNKLEKLATTLQQSILEVRHELNIHKEIIRKANIAALKKVSESGDDTAEMSHEKNIDDVIATLDSEQHTL